MTRVHTDDPAYADAWLYGGQGPGNREWLLRGAAERPAWLAPLVTRRTFQSCVETGFEGWDDVLVAREAPRSQFDALAEWQESGRAVPDRLLCQAGLGHGFHGQRGRVWETMEGNLHVTARVPLDLEVNAVGHTLTAVPALAVIDALEQGAGVRDARLKWVNDVVIGDAKIAGVIVRTHLFEDRFLSAVFGVGVNVSTSPGGPGHDDRATGGERPHQWEPVTRSTSVADLGPGAIHSAGAPVLSALGRALLARTEQLRERGAASIVSDYRDLCMVVGRVGVVCDDPVGTERPRELARGRIVGLGDQLELFFEGMTEPVTRGRLVLDDRGQA